MSTEVGRFSAENDHPFGLVDNSPLFFFGGSKLNFEMLGTTAYISQGVTVPAVAIKRWTFKATFLRGKMPDFFQVRMQKKN